MWRCPESCWRRGECTHRRAAQQEGEARDPCRQGQDGEAHGEARAGFRRLPFPLAIRAGQPQRGVLLILSLALAASSSVAS